MPQKYSIAGTHRTFLLLAFNYLCSVQTMDAAHSRSEPHKFSPSFQHLTIADGRSPGMVNAIELENFDENWSHPSTRRRATYTNLKPGQYISRVRGSATAGVWNETGARLAIALTPSFYQTAWFAGLCALLLGLVIYGGLRWRLRYLKAKQQDLEKLVAERTAQLRDTENLRLIAEVSPVAISVTRRSDSVILYVNQNTEPIFGLPHQQLIGRKASDFYDDPAESAKILKMIEQNVRLFNYALKIKQADDSTCWGLISCQPLVFQGIPALLTGYQDVTEHKLVEAALKVTVEELRDTEERYRALYDDNPFMYFTLNTQGTVLSVNRYGAEQIGYAAAELIGQSLTRIFHDEDKDKVSEQVELCLQNSKVNYCELRKIRKDGSLLWVGEYARAVRAFNGETVVLIVCNDITARKQTEMALRKSLDELQTSRERLRALSVHLQSLREQERLAIARDLHDELGQALTSLKMDMTMLKRKVNNAASALDRMTVLDDIEDMQKLVAGTINKVRNLITELRPEILDTLGLLPALEWQLEEFHKRTGLACEFHSDLKELDIEKGHAVAVFRIFQESLTNIARHAQAQKVTARIKKHDGALWVEVADDGKGMTAEDLNAPTKFGLLGMRERVLVFGGEVIVASAPGSGTIVRINIPLHETKMD